ncbi:MAG: 2-hydroxyacyl-CoA dehydratase family protein, partial [Desulfobacterales bacterium]|nr:2-hydroxyacyl-CoA dehydratase family protein [Desulfobacterales bacterium]
MFDLFHNVISNVSATITKYENESGKPVIGVMPAYFPMELIDAAGGYPVQLWGNNMPIAMADTYLQSYCCSVARSVLELEMKGSANMVKAYAFTSICDTLINLREIYRRLFQKPTFELAIPSTQTEQSRRNYLKNIIDSVTKGLEDVTGKKITQSSLKEASTVHAKSRELHRKLYEIRQTKPGLIKNYDFYATLKAGFFLPRTTYNDMLEELIKYLEKLPEPSIKRPKILMSGMVFDPIEAYKIFDELEVHIVDDDFANGWRTASKTAFNSEDIYEGVTQYLFHPSPCCCVYNPDIDRHEYLVQKIKKSGAQGVIFWYIKFCEPDAFDRP